MASETQGREFEQALGDSERDKPGVLQSMGSQRVGHDSSDLAAAAATAATRVEVGFRYGTPLLRSGRERLLLC